MAGLFVPQPATGALVPFPLSPLSPLSFTTALWACWGRASCKNTGDVPIIVTPLLMRYYCHHCHFVVSSQVARVWT